MKIIKGTVDSKIVKLSRPDAIKYIQDKLTLGIIGGEFAITYDEDDLPITTLLGSCVAVMIYDSVLQVKGMNHFLLPTSCAQGTSCRFGLYAMEAMLNEMYKLGCRKENLSAKIAGGANIVHDLSDNIGERNVLFARQFCRSEGIRIVAENVLGNNGRVVMLDRNFHTVAKTIANRSMDEKLAQADRALARAVNKTESAPAEGGVTLF
ncbi:MAG: chemotaxis protein CheD [Sulfuricurvum sp.]|jgi:chemotaxis protein CheD|nr:chemotaxis protein CheD [Sulfuricurvum sp.]MDX9966756.1 chemotaxis protein CheD [Sulfuricurvum sp.]